VLPVEVVEAVDRLAGKRKRSQFVEASIREKLERENLGRALKATAGMLNSDDYPEWSTPDKISAWVKESWRTDDARLAHRLGHSYS
jgi:hypothetical protein